MNIEEILEEFNKDLYDWILNDFVNLELAIKESFKSTIQKAIEQRDKEWQECYPDKLSPTQINKIIDGATKQDLQNLKDKKIID